MRSLKKYSDIWVFKFKTMKQKEKFNDIYLKLSSINHNNKILEKRIDSLVDSVKKMQDKLSIVEEPEILPCPFCGGAGMSFCRLINDEEFFYVKCTNGHNLGNMKGTEEEAIKEWNKRI